MLRLSDKRLVIQSFTSLLVILSLAAVAYSLSLPDNPLVLGLSSMYNP